MDLKRIEDIRDVDLPFIEMPSLAKSRVESWLRRGPGWGVNHYYRLTNSAHRGGYVDECEMIRCIIKAVDDGDLLLIMNDSMGQPFCPLVSWDGQQWRAQASGLSARGVSSLVSAYLPSLNARELGPVGMSTLQCHGDWGVVRPASLHEPRMPSKEVVVPDQPEGCVFAKSCSVPEGTIETGWMLEPATRFGNVAILGSTDAPAAASLGGAIALGRIAGAVGAAGDAGGLGSWALRLANVAKAGPGGILVTAFWPSQLGDGTILTASQLAELAEAPTRVRFYVSRGEEGVQVTGLHIAPGTPVEQIPVTQARWDDTRQHLEAHLNGVTITWTPGDTQEVAVPTPYPDASEHLDTVLVHPIEENPGSEIEVYPAEDDITWQDTIVVFPSDAGVSPLYLVFSKPADWAYFPAPKDVPGIPGLIRAQPKTPVQGGGKLRRRWKDRRGNIYEWDYQHGNIEKYTKTGRHLGEFDSETGEQVKPADNTRRVTP